MTATEKLLFSGSTHVTAGQTVSYSYSDNLSAELDLGLPYKHTFYGAGAVQGMGKIGTIESLPPTAFVQYRFLQPSSMFRPYLGLGLTYAYFQKATGSAALTASTNTGGSATTFKVDNKFAGTLQAGLIYNINKKWFADLTVTKTKLKTKIAIMFMVMVMVAESCKPR